MICFVVVVQGGGGGTTEHFCGDNEAFWWDFKSTVQKPSQSKLKH